MLRYFRVSMLKFCLLPLIIYSLSGCGFHLRGDLCLPAALQTLSICPDLPFDPFQRILRRSLRDNQVRVVENRNCPTPYNILSLTHQGFSERAIAYGSDVQINRILLQYKVEYQITDPDGNVILDCNVVQVERELTINPNAVLATEHDRLRVQNELYNDAAIQLIRQLSFACLKEKS